MTAHTLAMDKMLPTHAKVQIALQKQISQMQIGDKLIPERVMAEHFGVSRPTLRKAISRLCEDGILESRQGSGTFLMRPLHQPIQAAKRTRMLGLLMPTVRNPMIAQLVEAIEQVATARNYRIVLTHDHGDPKVQCQKLDQLLEHEVDGLIIYPDANNVCDPQFTDRLNQTVQSGTPLILVDRCIPGINAPSVVADTEAGMYQLTRHMLTHGRNRIAIISWGQEAGTAEQSRLNGFKLAMSQAGFEPTPLLHAQVGQLRLTEITSRQVIEKWLNEYQGNLPCDAILCFHDNMALGAYQALRQAGIRVPHDIALAGYDNLAPHLFEAAGLSLTTVNQPVGLIGDTAARLLIEHLDNDTPLLAKQINLRCDLLIRQSCGCDRNV